MTHRPFPILSIATILALSLAPMASAAEILTVLPGGVDNSGGGAQGPAPLRFPGSGGARTQQVYESQLFGGFDGPRAITGIDLRAFPGFAPGTFFGNSVTASNIMIRLSTTQRGDEGNALSATFANNIGADQTLVYAGALTLTTTATGATPVNPFDYAITFQNAFVYDPDLGNLLIDVTIPTDATLTANGAFGFVTFDTVNALNDGTYSVFNGASGNATTGNVGTSAPILRVHSVEAQLAAVPEPVALGLLGVGLMGLGLAQRRSRTVANP